jgi:CHAT domain
VSTSLYEGRIKQARRDLERATKRRAAEEKKAAAADREAARLERDAGRTKSASLAHSKLDRAARKRDEATRARAAAAKASDAAAEAQRKLGEAEQKLAAERAKLERRAREKAERERKKVERERARQEKARERKIWDLRSDTAQLAAVVEAAPWANAPEAITVLFIAASPEDQDPLRLDREVREIQRRVRMSEHRDAVRFEWRPATQVTDLLQILNETRPHVVHFSGHGDQHALAFEDADGQTKPLDNASLAALLHASSDRIRLAVFNSCESSNQAELACEHLDAAIGMERPVDDESAKVFASQFYNSIGFGRSLQQAFDQAKLQLELETGGLSGNPELYAAPGLHAAEIFLVAPPKS